MKIGILGGTFDPIHLGHLIIGEQAREELDLDKMLFIPTGNPAHKQELNVSSTRVRYEMLELAIEYNEKFEKSPIEINRDGKTYTVDTIRELKEEYTKDQIYFLVGEDSLFQLENWYKFSELKEMCNFVVCRRSVGDEDRILDKIDHMRDRHGMDIYLLNTPIIQISSTKIRENARAKRSIKYLVPQSVERYILENNVYGDDNIG